MTRQNGNGRASPLSAVANDVRHVAGDIVELAELQATLAKEEFEGYWKQFLMPIVLVGLAGPFALCCTLILLGSASVQLAESAQISLALSLLIVGLSGFAITGLMVGIAVLLAKNFRSPFPESKREFSRNLKWIKTVLSDVRHKESRQAYYTEHHN